MTVHWYPGHMAKARRLLEDNVRLVDVVVELRDARIPVSSANPLLASIIADRPRLLVLTKADLAEPKLTEYWLSQFTREGLVAMTLDARQSGISKRVLPKLRELAEPRLPRSRVSGIPLRGVRTLIAGIPNVGKSSLINSLSGRAAAKTGAMPGVTRAKQWIKLAQNVELLDTPGLLWPKLEDQEVAKRLAITGAVGQGGFDEMELAAWLLRYLADTHPALLERYALQELEATGAELLEQVGRRRGCLIAGGQVDLARAAEIVLGEFRVGKLGKITLDQPEAGR